MLSLNTWDVLFQGKYGSQELTILHNDDFFVSFLKSRDKKDVIVQVYKLFAVYGDVEIFAETLSHQCIVYEKHYDVGEKNTHKFFILNTETEYIDNSVLSNYIDKKIQELNRKTSTIVSVMKSYNLKLVSLKNLPKSVKNYFFSDPFLVKSLTNMPMSADLSGFTSIDKLLLGKKEKSPINITLDGFTSVFVCGGEEDERLFSLKLICELYLLSSKTVIVFDEKGVFKSLAYPQQNEKLLQEFDPILGPFGFPLKFVDYFSQIKIPFGSIPKQGLYSLFRFTGVGEKIISSCFDKSIIIIEDLINKIKERSVDEEVTEFEKERIISKLKIIDKKYNSYFGEIDVSFLFENKYKHLGNSKILKIDYNCPFSMYYIYKIIEELSLNVKDDLLIVLPESENLFSNIFVGEAIFSTIQENPKLNITYSSKNLEDVIHKDAIDAFIEVINSNDVVLKYTNRDPTRLLLRPTLSSSNIEFKRP